MHEIEERYYQINRGFLKLLGLWPYQTSYFALVQQILFSGILFAFIVVQLLAVVTMQFDINLLLKIFSILFPTLFATIKYCAFIIQKDTVRQLLELARNDWTSLKDNLEIGIIKKYAANMRLLTMIAIVLCHFFLLCCFILQLLPLILDVIIPLNTSRSVKLVAITEYFINREKYICVMFIHEVLIAYVGTVTICTTIITIMMYILHGCALFKIARYRIENAIGKDILVMSDFVRDTLLFQRIVHAVFMHRRAIRYIQLFESSFRTMFAILILVGVTSLSLNLFQLLRLISITNDFTEMCFVFSLIIFHFCYMFIINYGGEEVQNHGIQVFDGIYNGLWYIAPLHTQKLLLFIMQKARMKVTLLYGGIFIVSLEGFLTLASAGISYFTMIYSMRQ